MSMASHFSPSLSTDMGLSQPSPRSDSLSILVACHTLFLKQQRIFLELFYVIRLRFPISLDQEVAVIDKGQYIITHENYYPYSLNILSSIKYTFEFIFGACWLFVIANLLPPSLHSLLVVVIMKPSVGGIYRFKRHHNTSDVLMGSSWFWSGEIKSKF